MIPRWAAALTALGCGALLPLSMAPFGYWPLGLVALAGWFAVLRAPEVNGALSGWLFGVGKYGVGASWVYVSIHVHGNAAPPLAAALVAVFVAGLALFPLLNGWLYARLRGSGRWTDAVAFAALFSAFEWLLTWVLTGFPWLYAGYAHLDTVLGNLAPLGGVLLVGFALTLSATMLVLVVDSLRARRFPAALAAAVLGLTPWLLGWALDGVRWVQPGEVRQVALVQGNVDQRIKWQPENRLPILRTYQALSEPYWGADLIIWPEAALTIFAHQAGDVLGPLAERAERSGTAFVLGLPALERLPDGEIVFRNTAVALGAGSGRYVKRRLVPFGEYVPLESLLRGAIEFFDLPMSHAESGAWRQPLLDLGGHRGAMAICYEVVYPDLARVQAGEADVLLTISNDAWFGASIGPLQHVEMARMRALENGRYLLRGTNNGVTAIIDERGVVRGRLPQFEAGALLGEYRTMSGVTPFTRLGHWPLLIGLAVLLIGAVLRRRARGRPAAGDRG
ncbi:MAG: apolipoprotein N-acyltransferase [Pseudomonadales bacterium]